MMHVTQGLYSKIKPYALLLLSSMYIPLMGCISYEYDDLKRSETTEIPYSLQIGDVVNIITADGNEHEFKIESISASTVAGHGTSIQFDDMRIVRVRNIDAGKTFLDTGELTLWVLNIFLLIGLMVLAGA